jgi:hypothetical protein
MITSVKINFSQSEKRLKLNFTISISQFDLANQKISAVGKTMMCIVNYFQKNPCSKKWKFENFENAIEYVRKTPVFLMDVITGSKPYNQKVLP